MGVLRPSMDADDSRGKTRTRARRLTEFQRQELATCKPATFTGGRFLIPQRYWSPNRANAATDPKPHARYRQAHEHAGTRHRLTQYAPRTAASQQGARRAQETLRKAYGQWPAA